MRPSVTLRGAAVRLEGPLLFLERALEVGLHEAVQVSGDDGRARLGRVIAIDERHVTVELLDSSAGLALADTVARFPGAPIRFGVGPAMLGRVFNGNQSLDDVLREMRLSPLVQVGVSYSF